MNYIVRFLRKANKLLCYTYRFIQDHGVAITYKKVISAYRRGGLLNIKNSIIRSYHAHKIVEITTQMERLSLSDLYKYYTTTEYIPKNILSCSIVIPVYNGLNHLQRLLPALLENTDENISIIIVDDRSSDLLVLPYIQEMIKGRKNCHLIVNHSNLGFVKTINTGMALVETDIAIWLNTDTIVPKNWVERLVCQFNQFDKIATCTPFSNSAVTYSFPNFGEDNELVLPLEEVNEAFKKIQPFNLELNSSYSGTGFCMAVNMECWKEIGTLDEDAFDKGYGEENDWCMRAYERGWKHLIAPNLFVHHNHGGSFLPDEKIKLIEAHSKILRDRYPQIMNEVVPTFFKEDPWKVYRILASILLSDNAILYIDLSQKTDYFSGAINYSIDQIQSLKSKDNLILLNYTAGTADFSLTFISVSERINIALSSFEEINILFQLINIKEVVINNLAYCTGIFKCINVLYQLKKLYNITIIYKFHDHLSLCPSFFLLDNHGPCQYKDESICNNCIKTNQFKTINYSDEIIIWRRKFRKLFFIVNEVVFFSEYSRNIALDIFPEISDIAVVKEHLPLLPEKYWNSYTRPIIKDTINIAFIGTFCFEKGSQFFIELYEQLKNTDKVNFFVIGKNNYQNIPKGIKYLGGYIPSELGSVLTKNNIHVVIYPSISNETFSYVAQELMLMNVPFVCFDCGAPAERVRKYNYPYAEIVAFKSEDMHEGLQKLLMKVYGVEENFL